MITTIDVHDLPEEEIRFVQNIINLLKERERIKKVEVGGEKEKIAFASWPLGVKGKLTRQEIYDYL